MASRGGWTRWALEYQLLRRGEAARLLPNAPLRQLDDSQFSAVWFVELTDCPEAEEVLNEFAARKLVADRTDLVDRAGRPVVSIWRVANRSAPERRHVEVEPLPTGSPFEASSADNP